MIVLFHLGGFLQLYSNTSFGSAGVCECLHTCTQLGQKDSPPPPLDLHRTRQRQSAVISGILLTLQINDPMSLLKLRLHITATQPRLNMPLFNQPFLSLSHTLTHLLFIVLRVCKHNLGHTCRHTHADTPMRISC